MEEKEYRCINWNDEPPIDCGGCTGREKHTEEASKALNELCGYYEPIVFLKEEVSHE